MSVELEKINFKNNQSPYISDTNLNRMQTNIENAINYVEDKISDEFDSTKNYSEGQYCIYNNILYKANEDITAGAWDSTKWTATTIGAELESRLEFELVEEIEDEEEEEE